jgi:hypothetical protein
MIILKPVIICKIQILSFFNKYLNYRSRTGDNFRVRQENYGLMLAFDVNEFFSFGSPLSLILAYRRMLTDSGNLSIRFLISYIFFFLI